MQSSNAGVGATAVGARAYAQSISFALLLLGDQNNFAAAAQTRSAFRAVLDVALFDVALFEKYLLLRWHLCPHQAVRRLASTPQQQLTPSETVPQASAGGQRGRGR